MSFIKFLRARLSASNCFLDKEELQPLCSLVNSTTKHISKNLLDAKTTIVTLISTSVSVCFRGISRLPSAFVFCDDSNLRISLFKYVFSTMGVTKESISKFLIGNRFHVKLRILSPYSKRIVKSICLINASWCAFEWKHPYEFGPVFEILWKYKAAFPTIHLLLSAGLTVGVSTATCEASFSSVVGYSHLIASAWHTTRQGRNEVRQRPGQEASLAPPCSNLMSLGSKCTVFKKVLVTLFGLFGAPAVIRPSP